MQLYFMIMTGILQWMHRLQIEHIGLVEQKMSMYIDWLRKEQLRRESLKGLNRNRMFKALFIVGDFRVINLNHKKYFLI